MRDLRLALFVTPPPPCFHTVTPFFLSFSLAFSRDFLRASDSFFFSLSTPWSSPFRFDWTLCRTESRHQRLESQASANTGFWFGKARHE